MLLHTFSSRRRRQHGVTLILVLSFVLLLTAVVLVFLSRMMNARQLSSGSLKQSSSDQFALSALDVVTGNLKQEIASSTTSTYTPYPSSAQPTYAVYRPLSSTNAVPIRFGNPAFAATTYPTLPSDPAPNLIRISSRSDSGQSFPSSLASGVNSTLDASVNGRSISLPRWNSHYLLPLAGSTDTTPASFNPPDWVLVTDTGGPQVVTPSNFSTLGPSVIGRYAYAIYDEGGLLDVNVAGNPSNSTVAHSGHKPALAYADLTQLALPSAPTTPLLKTTDVDNLVGWRNYASVHPSGSFGGFTMNTAGETSFFNLIANNVTGFLSTSGNSWTTGSGTFTDQAFLSRQQLLKYAVSAGLNLNALQYLGTFSRDINAPSWSPVTPTAGIPSWGTAISSGSTYDYTSHKNDSTAVNRDILGVRVTGTFTRADGTTAQVGEPLVKYRFPLNRLQGLTYQGIDTTDTTTLSSGTLSPATAATIQRDFGLAWVTGDGNSDPMSPSNTTFPNADIQSAPHWNYCGSAGTATTPLSSIETLAQVAAENREPNFFELLKAAILSGSLGRDAGANGEWFVWYEQGPSSGIQAADLDVDAQVIQLGANIIDQSDTDSYPTEIHFQAPDKEATPVTRETAFYGIENLPYIQRVFAKVLTHYTDTITPVTNGNAGWYMAEVWNPHQNFGYTNTTTLSTGTAVIPPPTNFRYCGDGGTEMYISTGSTTATSTVYYLENSGYLQFSVNPVSGGSLNSCREPTFLCNDSNNPGQGSPSVLSPTIGPLANGGSNGNDVTFNGGTVQGLYAGVVTIPSDGSSASSTAVFPQQCNLYLEYSPDGGTTWRIYDEMRNLMGWVPWGGDPSPLAFYYEHVDPRTDRFGTTHGQWTYNPGPGVNKNPPGGCIRVDSGNGYLTYDYFPLPSSGFNYTAGNSQPQIYNNFYMGTLSDNIASSATSYVDQDGVLRPAEGCYAFHPTGSPYDGYPMVPGNPNSRPIILNRPFRNVGELGYAFRDLPWKNIDFFTPYTGDAGLLDFFCINESTTASPVVAGTVNLNTRQAPVLQAILAGAIKNEVATTTGTITGLPAATPDAAAIASNIVAWTQSSASGQGPFQYRGDLLTKAGATLVASSESNTDQQIKIRREAAVRALSDNGTTRTWTLLVDLVAQVGHYPPGATSLKQFVVDGEKRYWLHLTLDRYTGQVVDRVLEPVYE